MCIKTTYLNTYIDGTQDRTERVDACSTGFLCTHPTTDTIRRSFDCTKAEFEMNGYTYYAEDRRGRNATPRSISPRSGSDTERKHRRRRSSIYLTAGGDPSTTPYVPQPPSPIPIQRSSTMTYGFASPPSRGRAPIIITDPAPRRTRVSATIPIGPVEVIDHASSRRRSSRRDSTGMFLSPDLSRRHSRSPQGYTSAEDEREREERRRKRREHKAQAAMFSSSVPTPYNNNDLYSSSIGSTSSSHTSSFVSPSPAARRTVKKELRFEDDERARQNAKISSRPKLDRAEAVRMSAAQGEVKSILKNSTSTSPSGRVRASSRGEEIDELYRSMEGLGIRERETSAQRLARQERERADEAQKNRLSRRFDLPSGGERRFTPAPLGRSYTMGTGGRQSHQIWYPEQRTYRTQY